MYSDEQLACVDCKREFLFSAGEAAFFAEKGFVKPKRCRRCRASRAGSAATSTSHMAVCAECGGEARVPFEPAADRPVYCRHCFSARRSA